MSAPSSPNATIVVPEVGGAGSIAAKTRRSALSRTMAWLSRCSEWLLLVALVAACIPAIVVRRDALTDVPAPVNVVDQSWTLDICYKATRGVWLGRDSLFTYGPLYEWLSGAPARWLGASTGTILATANMLPMLAGVLAIFITARLLLRDTSPWWRALFLAVVLWTFPGIRIAICLCAFAIFLRLADAVACRRIGIVWAGLGAAVIGVASFLISTDAGIYTAAALVLCLAATALVKRQSRGVFARLAWFFLATTLAIAVLVVAANAVTSSPLDFSYWKSSLLLAASYRWLEPRPMTAGSTLRIVAALAFAMAAFVLAWWRRRPEEGCWTQQPAYLLSASALGLLMMQSGIVRSDVIHVVNGIYPLVFFGGAICLAAQVKTRWISAVPLVIFIATTPLITIPGSQSFPAGIIATAHQIFRPNCTCPPGKQEFDGACYPPSYAKFFAAISGYVDQHTEPGDPILAFPYQNALGVMSRRTVASGVLQAYLVSGDYLSGLDLAGLRKANPPFGLYFPEPDPSLGLNAPEAAYSYSFDLVPNITRSPGIWFYLLRHYHAEPSAPPGVVGLVRDDSSERRMIFTEEKAGEAPGTIPIRQRWTRLELGQLHWPAAGADFLRLRFRANYPLWWKLRKPSSLALWMYFADGSAQVLHFVVEPNRDSDVWIYPGDLRALGGYFSNDSSRWPTSAAPMRLAMWITPFDWVSVMPQSVSIEAIDAVRMSLK